MTSNETLSYFTHEMVRDLIKQKDISASLQKVVQLIHFNPSHPENSNVYIASEDDRSGFLTDDAGQWKADHTNNIAYKVMKGAAVLMDEHADDCYEAEYTDDEMSRYVDYRFDKIDNDYTDPLDETIATIVRNKRVVEALHPRFRTIK
jgi:sugar diacid utilization regulator